VELNRSYQISENVGSYKGENLR